MKIKLSILTLLLTLSGFGTLALANENQDLSTMELDQIKATCKEDSRDTENLEYYTQECINEGISALKEERGLVVPDKEES